MRTIRRVFVTLPVVAFLATSLTSVVGIAGASADPAQTVDDAGPATLAVRQLTRRHGRRTFPLRTLRRGDVGFGAQRRGDDDRRRRCRRRERSRRHPRAGHLHAASGPRPAAGRPDRRPLGIHRRRVRRRAGHRRRAERNRDDHARSGRGRDVRRHRHVGRRRRQPRRREVAPTTDTTNPPTTTAPAPPTTAAPTPTADDGDGIAATIEDAAPNGGDGNRDGLVDSRQSNVASLPAAVDVNGNGALDDYVTIVAPEGTTLTNVRALEVPERQPAARRCETSVRSLRVRRHGREPGRHG